MTRLPQIGSDDGTWGAILNEFLSAAHNADGTLKNDTVGTNQLKSGAVTGGVLADGSVTEAKLDAAVVAKLNTTGGVSDHGALTGLADDDHAQYLTAARGDGRYYTQAQVNSLVTNAVAGVVTRVVYAGSWPARPSVTYVEWVGPVDPGSAAQNGDTWIDTSS